MQNQECYNKEGKSIGWLSRSIAVVALVFVKDKEGDWCVLASVRGPEAADYQGYWNVTCGYLDYDETCKQAACRELKEETGVVIKEDDLHFVGYVDNPLENRQNVSFRFCTFITDRTTDDFMFSHAGNEGKEVGDIKFIKVKDIGNYDWAFGHRDLIITVFLKEKNTYVSDSSYNRLKVYMNKWVYFTLNYPYDFIWRVWGGSGLAEHLQSKFNNIIDENRMDKFYCELDKSNQSKLLEWVIIHYDREPKTFR